MWVAVGLLDGAVGGEPSPKFHEYVNGAVPVTLPARRVAALPVWVAFRIGGPHVGGEARGTTATEYMLCAPAIGALALPPRVMRPAG